MLLHIILVLGSALCVQGGYYNQELNIPFESQPKVNSYILPSEVNAGVNTYKDGISYYLPKEESSVDNNAEQINNHNSYQSRQRAISTPRFVYNVEDKKKNIATVNNLYNNRETFILKEPETLQVYPSHHVTNRINENDKFSTPSSLSNVQQVLEPNNPILLNTRYHQLPLLSNGYYSSPQLNIQTPSNIKSIETYNSQILPTEPSVHEVVGSALNEPHLLNTLDSLPIQNAEKNIQIHDLQPVINKHYYFHVPPNDVEETRPVPVDIPKKKTYNIIFINLPKQEPKNLVSYNTAYSNIAPIEDKILIYVLVKKNEEIPQVTAPPHKPSEHEVLFVNYKQRENNLHIEKQTTNNKQLLNPTQLLLSGLVNGQRISV